MAGRPTKTKNNIVTPPIESKLIIENTKTENIIEEIIEEIIEVPIKREVDLNDQVLIMNNTSGILVIKSTNSSRALVLDAYGKKARMRVSDIMDVIADQAVIFDEGWAIILDDDVVEYLNLTSVNEKVSAYSNIERLFNMNDDEIENIIKELPNSLKSDIIRIVKEKLQSNDKRLDSMKRIKMFEKVLNVKFND